MSRRSDRLGIAPESLSLPITARGSHAQALRIAAGERARGLKGQARVWLKRARWELRWCPYHRAYDALPRLPG